MGHFLKDMYTYLYKDVFRERDKRVFMAATGWLIAAIFFALSGLFMIADKTGRPRWMYKYKTQPGHNDKPVDWKTLWKALKLVLFNQFVVGSVVITQIYPLYKRMGCSAKPEDFPNLVRLVRDFIGTYLLREVMFYYLHRLFHWGPLYRYIHKKHHEFQSPMAMTAVYAHPLEHLLVNMTSTSLPPILMGSHAVSIFLWYAYAITETMISHSGYHLPFMMSPEFHDYHHYKFVGNYGSIGLLDWLHDTSATFRKAPQYQRNQVFTGLTPMTTVYPDKKADTNNNTHAENQ